ncbi:RHS domain-containing protein [Enterobacteriaceae bacterium BIT-l23]|nr:RHS domain-containing protein [Enterobacteriaceae bacterium BIT-l23]
MLALGRRIAKAVTTRRGTVEIRFLLLQSREGERCATYLYDPNETWSPLARVDHPAQAQDGECYWFTADLNGAPLEVTDADGAVRWSGQYGSFGEVSHQTAESWALRQGKPTINQPLRYAGQYADSETGLHYNLFRYYDPGVGRFTTQDPIGLQGGLNLYQYAPNPLGWVDPLGLTACAHDGYYNRKSLRTDIYNAQRPGSYHAVKHTQAKTAEEAKSLSLGKGARKGDPEASYLPGYASKVAGFEKQAAYDAVRNGNVFEHGGTRFMFYKNPTGAVGYNSGQLTDWVRIEMTNTGVPIIHSFPASPTQVSKYMNGVR